MLPKVLHIGHLPFSYKRIFRFSWYLSMHLIGRVLYTGSIPRINDTKGYKKDPPPFQGSRTFLAANSSQ